jgi:hypothetical protein
MKRLVKKLGRTLWSISSAIRMPIVRKFDEHMMQLLRASYRPSEVPPDLELALSSVVRELARLQMQIEILQQQVDDLQLSGRERAQSERRLSVVGEI